MVAHFWYYFLMLAIGAADLGFAYRNHARGNTNSAAFQIAGGVFVIGLVFLYLLGGVS